MNFTNAEKADLAALGYELLSDCYAAIKRPSEKLYIRKMEDGTLCSSTHHRVDHGPGEGQWFITHVMSTYSSFMNWRIGKSFPVKQRIWNDQTDVFE